MADLGYAFMLEPEAAVRYFEGLGYNVPADWNVKWSEAQAKARAIAGIYRQDIAAHIHQSLYSAMKNGTTFATFRDEIDRRLKAGGFSLLKDGDIVDLASGEVVGKNITKHRLETIFRTQMQNAYAAGKWQAIEETRDTAPWLQYSAVLDMRTRESHSAAHGAVYHIDDPFWDYFYPPNGFNCRCTVKALSGRDLTRKGLSPRTAEIEDVEIVVDKKGRTRPAKAVKMPDGSRFYADAGFNGNVGKSHLANLGQLQMQRALDLPPRLASVAVRQTLKQPELRQAINKNLTDRVNLAVAEIARGEKRLMGRNKDFWHVGAFDLGLLALLERAGISPETSLITLDSHGMYHLLRTEKSERKTKKGEVVNKAFPPEFIGNLTDRLLEEPKAVLRQIKADVPTLLFVYEFPDMGQFAGGKLVVKINYRMEMEIRKGSKIGNRISSAEMIFDERTLQDSNSYELLKGNI